MNTFLSLQLKKILQALQSEMEHLRESIESSSTEQIHAIRDATEANRQSQEKIQTHLSELRIPENEKRDAQTYREKNHTVQVILAVGTCGAFLAAAIYAGIAGCQYREMRIATETSRESLQAVQRAFVTFLNVNIDTVPMSLQDARKQNKQWILYGAVENSGTTPAIERVNYFTANNRLKDEPSEQEFIGDDKDRQIGEIGPKAQKSIGLLVLDQRFFLGPYSLGDIGTPGFMDYFRSRRFFIWGWVGYRDVFPGTDPHVTEFCEEVNGIAAMIHAGTVRPQHLTRAYTDTLTPRLSLKECSSHNCTDKNCPDYDQIAALVPNPK